MTCNVKRPVLLPTSNLGKFTAHREPDAIRVPGAVAGILFAKLGNRRVLWHKAASKIKGFRPRCLPRHDKDLGHNVRVTAVASTHSTLNVGGDRSEVTLVGAGIGVRAQSLTCSSAPLRVDLVILHTYLWTIWPFIPQESRRRSFNIAFKFLACSALGSDFDRSQR